jgi:hypothetical protein
MLSISPNTKEYIALRKELTDEELLLLKKLLKRRSDESIK